MSLHPRALPKLRDQTLRFLDDPSAPVRAGTGVENQAGLDALADHLRVGGLYWATADMTALAVSSGSQLAAARWATADRPSACGLILFEGGVGHIDSHGVNIPIDGCAWGPYQDTCMIWTLLSRRRLAQQLDGSALQLDIDQIPPLIPSYGFTLPTSADPVPMAQVDPAAPQPVVGALAASWLLMQQPTLVDHVQAQPTKAVRRAYARRNRPNPEVTVIDLRRQYVPHNKDSDNGGQRYRHRWVVSGHWRNQPYGPGREQRRQQWIPSYVKGPDGAPLLKTERVNVWRR